MRDAMYRETAASRRVAPRRPVTHRGRRSIDRVGREGLQGSGEKERARERRETRVGQPPPAAVFGPAERARPRGDEYTYIYIFAGEIKGVASDAR